MRTPSIYQAAIFDFVKNETGSAVIQACAGSGKTTTVIDCLKLIPTDKSILMVAFNKTIALERKERVPSHVTVKTFNGLGHSMVARRLGSLRLESRKIRLIVEGLIDAYNFKEFGNEVITLANFARRSGLVPKNVLCHNNDKVILKDETESWTHLINHFSIDIPVGYRQSAIDYARSAIAMTFDIAAKDRIVDYDDQIYIPVVKGSSNCDKYDYIFVDEAQDASPSRIRLVEMSLAENGRVIIVGDERQAIYGFTGADSKAMHLFKETFNAVEMPLSICYRCAKSVVVKAKEILPSIEYHESAKDGVVRELDTEWDASIFEIGDMVACRKNAPLVSLAMKLLSSKIGCRILGRDLSGDLIGLCKKLRPQGLIGRHGLEEKIDAWRTSEVKRWTEEKNDAMVELVNDKADCIKAILKNTTIKTVPDFYASIEAMFSDDEDGKNTITLCSVHKSKGLEADRVFILKSLRNAVEIGEISVGN